MIGSIVVLVGLGLGEFAGNDAVFAGDARHFFGAVNAAVLSVQDASDDLLFSVLTLGGGSQLQASGADRLFFFLLVIVTIHSSERTCASAISFAELLACDLGVSSECLDILSIIPQLAALVEAFETRECGTDAEDLVSGGKSDMKIIVVVFDRWCHGTPLKWCLAAIQTCHGGGWCYWSGTSRTNLCLVIYGRRRRLAVLVIRCREAHLDE